MATSFPRLLWRELRQVARERQPCIPSAQTLSLRRQFCTSAPRSFGTRSALRNATSRPHAHQYAQQSRIVTLSGLVSGGGLLSVFYATLGLQSPTEHTTATLELSKEGNGPETNQESSSSSNSDELPNYRLSEVKKHGADSERPWVTLDDKIYDITEWIPAHPGGEVILRAAGGALEPYWNIFKIHSKPYVREILQEYLVGKIHPDDLQDGKPSADAIEDPFATDPKRDARFSVLSDKPFSGETPGGELADNFLTPNEVFYIRHHMWVPVVEAEKGDDHGITVELPDGEIKTYTIAELKSKFKQYTVTAVMQCSGNRRRHMTEEAKKTNGLQWNVGAISCAKWEGVRLMDVLADAGLPGVEDSAQLPEDAKHVQFSGLEAYGASIPISSAIDPHGDVLLAFKMNDEPLPRDHGFPVRVVVPGHVAARCVKWLRKIVVSDEESNTSWQRRDYKCFGPNEVTQDWDKYKSIQAMPVTSAITRVMAKPGSEPGPSQAVQLEGYAYSGGGHAIQRVDVSLDGGLTWDQATMLDDSKMESGSKAWCWKRWRYEGAVDGTTTATLVVKATDDAYNTQPQTQASIYNLRGNLATAWHRVQWNNKDEADKSPQKAV